MNLPGLLRRTIRSRWFGVSVGLVVLAAWAQFLRDQMAALAAYRWQIAPWVLGLSLGWGLVYTLGWALAWAVLLRRVDARVPVSIAATMRIWLRTNITRYIPGNVWHILSRIALAEHAGVRKTSVLVSSTLEQMLAVLAALAVFAVTLPLWPIVSGSYLWLVVLIPLGLALLHPRIFGTILVWAATKVRRPELAWRYSYRELLALLMLFSGVFFLSGGALYTILGGLTPVTLAHLPLVIGAAALAWAVGYLSFLTPSGLGVREAVLVGVLAQVFPLPVVIVTSLLYRIILTVGELVAVLLALVPTTASVSKA